MKRSITQLLMGLTLAITILVGGFLSQPVKAGVGDTIAQTFPDADFAQAVATRVAGGNVNAILTQDMVDDCTSLYARNRGILNVTGIDTLINLQWLNLDDNSLTELPDSISDLSSLNMLQLSNNKLTSLPNNIGNLSDLEYLHLSGNELTSLPTSIGNLESLITLYLADNRLTSLPSSVGNLNSLTGLNVGENELTNLPDTINNLENLNWLYLNENYLTCLPENIDGLANLVTLNLYDNQLTSLPESIGSLEKLQELFLQNSLLPTDYQNTLNALGLGITTNYETQRQLTLKTGLSPYTITSQSDLNAIDLLVIVELDHSGGVSPSQHLILENYVDENYNTVNIEDYISNGIVQKAGTVFAQVRATGTGLFPNNSDHAITVDKIEMNFETTNYNLSFDLNGALGTVPPTQLLIEGGTGTAVDNPSRDGYAFKEWNTAQNGSGTKWIVGTTPMPANDVTLYAQWEKNTNPVTPTPDKESNGTNPENQETGLLFKRGIAKDRWLWSIIN